MGPCAPVGSGRTRTAEITSSTAKEKPIKRTSRQGFDKSARRPKAMPGFSVWTMLKKPGITASESHAEKWLLIASLVSRSSRTTAAAMKKGTTRWFISLAKDFLHGIFARGANGREP